MKQYKAFYVPYFSFVLIFSVLIFINSKADLHLWITTFHSPSADLFFHYFTYLGDWFPFAIGGALIFYRYRIAFFILLSQVGSGLASIIIKQIWNEPRPSLYFQQKFPGIELHKVAGEHLHSFHSFPSGHTVTAFAFFLAIAFFTKNQRLHFLYLVLALLVGYSRIYLSQHFAIDVLAGSIIGVSATIMCKYYFDKKPLKWSDGSLRDVFLRK